MRPTLGAVRTMPPASNAQYTQPVRASSEYTLPAMLPTNTRPPTTVMPAQDCTSPGSPNAHFNSSRGTSFADKPVLDDWKRVFERFCPKPFQAGCEGSMENPASARHIALGAGAIVKGSPSDLPLANSAIARR